ncbi:MAG: 5-formyltetrahydrofolate cyclo-ligase [Phycisphaerales bacterium]|nr:5-formyltetrahydrofolate cyclo-ligase [Phycisphaerales bacterium]
MNPELKSNLRGQFKGVLANAQVSKGVCHHLQRWPAWNSARVIMGFMALGSEPDVLPALRQAFARGAQIAFPIVDGDTIQVGVVASMNDEHFTADSMGVKSPSAWTPIHVDALDIVLVPGIAFDKSGGRLGRGGGFYDRFLSKIGAGAQTVGVTDARRIVQSVPMEPHDCRVRWLVSDASPVTQT